MKSTKVAVIRLLPLALLALAACRQEPAPAAPAAAVVPAEPPAAAPDSRFAWYMEGRTPAGHTAIVRHGDGRFTSESFIHWNNREWQVASELQLDEHGLPLRQRITGTTPYHAPIDESFVRAAGRAQWKTVGEQGELPVEGREFYFAAESGAFESLPALVRAALRNVNHEITLLPSGIARVERVNGIEVLTDAGVVPVSLYAVHGLGFTPSYVWLDDDLELAGIDISGYLGMIPAHWDAANLATMSRMQLEENARYVEQLAEDLAIELDQPVIIENVDVVDVARGELLRKRHLRLAGGIIERVSREPIDDDSARRIDGSGKTLIPGLWDMHGHFAVEDGVLNIAGGITSVRDIGNVHEQVMEAVALYDSGAAIGPHTYRAGFIDKAGPFASAWAAETLEDALGRVDFLVQHGYLQVKLYSSIEPAWVAPIAERAHAHGLRLSGHIPAYMSAEQAIRAGYDEIQHINMVFLNFIVGDRGDTRQQIRFTEYGDHGAEVDPDSQAVADFIALLKQHDIVIDPTAAIFETMLTHRPGNPDPTYAAVIDHLPPILRRPMYNPDMVPGENWAASARRQAEMLKKLFDAGVRLVPGSDGIAAFTLHRELEVYVEAGMPTADVLRMATLDSAQLVGAGDRTGSIEAGKAADLVLLDGNPLEDISAVRRAVLVLKGATAYRPDRLYRAVGVQPFVDSLDPVTPNR